VFAKHLPPSLEQPRVLALDASAGAELAGLGGLTLRAGDSLPPGPFDAVAGAAPPESVPALVQHLRPGGRLILTAGGPPESLLAALTGASLIHCLVEPQGAFSLYRGERPPAGTPLERHARLAGEAPPATDPLRLLAPHDLSQRFLFILVAQTPNKPAWKPTPADRIEWRAATVRHPRAGQPALLAFAGLVRAVAFMQSAVLAGMFKGINKVGKFPAEAARAWGLPVLVNPQFEAVRGLEAGPPLGVDPAAAITGEE